MTAHLKGDSAVAPARGAQRFEVGGAVAAFALCPLPSVSGLKMERRAADFAHPWFGQKQLGKLRKHVSKAPNRPEAEQAGHRVDGWVVASRTAALCGRGVPGPRRGSSGGPGAPLGASLMRMCLSSLLSPGGPAHCEAAAFGFVPGYRPDCDMSGSFLGGDPSGVHCSCEGLGTLDAWGHLSGLDDISLKRRGVPEAARPPLVPLTGCGGDSEACEHPLSPASPGREGSGKESQQRTK